MTEWISVDDDLPPEGNKVLVAIDVNNNGEWLCVGIAHQEIRGGTWYDEETDVYGDYVEWFSEVSHWMPLPTHPAQPLPEDRQK